MLIELDRILTPAVAIRTREELERRLADQEAFRAMLGMIVVRALRDIVNYRDRPRVNGTPLSRAAKKRLRKLKELHDEANDWIYTERWQDKCDMDRLMCFEVVCAILGWDADWVRKHAKDLKKEDLQRLSLHETTDQQ